MNIPNSVIYVVGDVLGSWYCSHPKLNTLFGDNEFPGDPPIGNCVAKCQEWLRRTNNTPDCDPFDLLGRVLVEFMNMDRDDDPDWEKARQRVTDVLEENGYAFEFNGHIVTLAVSTSAEPMFSVPEISPKLQPNPQQHSPPL